MDTLMVDITEAGQAIRRGDEAVLLGAGGMPLEEAAHVAGTIPYELACLVTARVARVYLHQEPDMDRIWETARNQLRLRSEGYTS